jgi:signal transduction histidine kinase
LLSSFEYGAVFDRVARLATESLADWCLIEVDGGCEAEAYPEFIFVHRDPARADLFRKRRAELDPLPGLGLLGIQGRAELMDLPSIEARGASPELVSAFRNMGTTSLAVAPMHARGRLLGAILFGAGSRLGAYGPADTSLLESLAHRSALAIDNSRLYQDAQAAIAARDEFLSIASHELRTPLTPLLLNVQSLLQSKKPAEEPISRRQLVTVLGRSEKQVRRLATLIDRLLDVSRIGSGGLRLQLEDSVDLAEIVREFAERFSDDVARAGSTLEVLGDSSVIGRWDRLRIEQVVTNLLTNAIKYGAQGPVTIHVLGGDETATLSVRDHGIGIPPDKLPRIFNRFERAVSSRSYGGLGLGLYITRQILDAHGGSIAVVSQEGAGSTFTVELPLRPPIALAISESGEIMRTAVNGSSNGA